jgi:hypothetical protein
MGGNKKCIQIIVGKPEEKQQLRKLRRGWDINKKNWVLRNQGGGCGLDSSGSG